MTRVYATAFAIREMDFPSLAFFLAFNACLPKPAFVSEPAKSFCFELSASCLDELVECQRGLGVFAWRLTLGWHITFLCRGYYPHYHDEFCHVLLETCKSHEAELIYVISSYYFRFTIVHVSKSS